jgi:hypothetical protein
MQKGKLTRNQMVDLWGWITSPIEANW